MRRPSVIQTSDLDELKTWIGLHDQVVKGRCYATPDERREIRGVLRMRDGLKPTAAPGPSLAAMVKDNPRAGAMSAAIRSHARSYLFGDSRLVKDAKAAIEDYFGSFQIPVWPFTKVKVSSGSVLLFGTGSNVLLASELEIEEGGQVASYGSLQVNVVTLRKTVPSVKFPPLDLNHALADIFGR